MAISPARVAAFEILLRVERENGYSSELLHSAHYSKLFPADHGLTMELVMGVLRWRSLLDAEITRFSSQKMDKLDPEVLTALRMATFQIAFLDRVPAHAAVHESVELVKHARKRSAVSIVLPKPEVRASLEKSGIVLLKGELLNSAARVQCGDLFEFRAGRIAIQDEASQLVALLVGKGSNILDCCAAPGGKTRLLAE